MIKFLPALMGPSTKEEQDKEKKKTEGKEPPTGLSVSCYKLWQAHFPKSGTHIYVLLSIQVSEKEENVCSGWLKLITSFSFCNKFRILTNLYHESLFICPFFLTQTTFLNYNLNSQYLHESISHVKKFFFPVFYTNRPPLFFIRITFLN